MSTFIHRLQIRNFKSLYRLDIENLDKFSVFAGANGSGKSNFFDALDFISQVIQTGVKSAINAQGGYDHLRPAQTDANVSPAFSFFIDCQLGADRFEYELLLNNLHTTTDIQEKLKINGELSMSRDAGQKPKINGIEQGLSHDHSALLLYEKLPLSTFFRNIRIYRIQPLQAAKPGRLTDDSSVLNTEGSNLAAVLQRLEQRTEAREGIMDWMELIVPGLENIATGKKNLTQSPGISFKESGTQRYFPANMVSSGTMYLLCLLVIVFDSPAEFGLSLLEEPEEGLHPKAVKQMVELLKESAHDRSPIWLTTHSGTIVSQLKLEEFWLVDKEMGKTLIQHAASGQLTNEDMEPLGLDEMWLANIFNRGTPW